MGGSDGIHVTSAISQGEVTLVPEAEVSRLCLPVQRFN